MEKHYKFETWKEGLERGVIPGPAGKQSWKSVCRQLDEEMLRVAHLRVRTPAEAALYWNKRMWEIRTGY